VVRVGGRGVVVAAVVAAVVAVVEAVVVAVVVLGCSKVKITFI
jgi:hypothetical protein